MSFAEAKAVLNRAGACAFHSFYSGLSDFFAADYIFFIRYFWKRLPDQWYKLRSYLMKQINSMYACTVFVFLNYCMNLNCRAWKWITPVNYSVKPTVFISLANEVILAEIININSVSMQFANITHRAVTKQHKTRAVSRFASLRSQVYSLCRMLRVFSLATEEANTWLLGRF